MKKEATPKRKGLKRKTFDEKKQATQKRKGLKKASDGKRGNPKCKGLTLSIKISDRKWVSEKTCFAELTLKGDDEDFSHWQ
jgi:hypothetical protein